MRRIYLNGRFLAQPITGVQRYAVEIIRALDNLIEAGEVPERLASAQWTLLAPARIQHDLALRRIGTRSIGQFVHPYLWDQTQLPAAARDGFLVSLSNRGPVLHRRHLVVIHDAIVFRHPEFYSRGYVAFHRAISRLLARSATIATVSEFSRRELAEVLHKDAGSIAVLPNGANHLASVRPDDSVLDELDLRERPFFLALGSLNGNKNVGLAARAFAMLNRPDARLIIVGSQGAIFKSVNIDTVPGVVRAGRLSDERIASLYAHARAFVFPSIYEGFGIPPLEAMAFGSAVLASTAEAVRETCGEAASYFAPEDATALRDLLAQRLGEGSLSPERRQRQMERAAEFTWERSARRLLAVIDRLR